MTTADPACETCRYMDQSSFQRGRVLKGGPACRIRAPQADERGHAYWPLVDSADWCGEYVGLDGRVFRARDEP